MTTTGVKYLSGTPIQQAAACQTVTLGPACVNLDGIRAGDRNLIQFTITQSGAPLDLTGMALQAQARKTALDPDPPAISAVITVVNAANGVITVRWPGDAVRTAMAGAATWTGVWDLQAQATGEDPFTLVSGTFGAVTDVTR